MQSTANRQLFTEIKFEESASINGGRWFPLNLDLLVEK